MCVAYAQARTHTARPHVRTCVLSENSNTSGGRTPTEPQTSHTTHNAVTVTQNEQSEILFFPGMGGGGRIEMGRVGGAWGRGKGGGEVGGVGVGVEEG